MFKLKERLSGIDKQTLLFKGGLIALMLLIAAAFFFLGYLQLGDTESITTKPLTDIPSM